MTEAPQTKDASAAVADASFAEIAQRRRGRIRRYFFTRPRAMDAVVVLCYVLLALPTIIASIGEGKWLVVAILLLIALALVFRRQFPLQVVLAVALLERRGFTASDFRVFHPDAIRVSAAGRE